MSAPDDERQLSGGADVISVAARVTVGCVYLFMGWSKIQDPVSFLKLVRQYDMVDGVTALNAIAIVLPWLEVFCGCLLLAGIALRGTALVSLGMLIPFTVLVWQRALELRVAGQPFCAVRFDCGCGSGEVAICDKLAENGILIVLSAWLLMVRHSRWCLLPWIGVRRQNAAAILD